MPEHDLLVIGAGPAGCAAAIRGHQLGLRVLVIEAARTQRPVPGETLHPGIECIFQQLGIYEQIQKAGFLRHSGIWRENETSREFVPYGEDEHGPWRGFQADRMKLNRILWNKVRAQGVTIQTGIQPVEPVERGGRLAGVVVGGQKTEARWTVDATGRKSWLANTLDLNYRYHSRPKFATYGWRPATGQDVDTSPTFRSMPSGWDWAAQLADGRTAWVRLETKPIHTSLSEQRGIDVTWRLCSYCAGDGYYLLGDAAALLDPSSSHGVLRAMMSGIQCAHLCAHVSYSQMSDSEASRRYRQWLCGQFKHDVEKLNQTNTW